MRVSLSGTLRSHPHGDVDDRCCLITNVIGLERVSVVVQLPHPFWVSRSLDPRLGATLGLAPRGVLCAAAGGGCSG